MAQMSLIFTEHQTPVPNQCKRSARDPGMPTEEFEAEENCCVHCDHVRQQRAASAASNLRRPRSRPPVAASSNLTDEDLVSSDFEATVIEPLHRGRPHMMTLEAVEEERTPGTTPSPSFFPDIHHNQKMLL